MGQTSFTISLQRLGKDILQSGHVIPVQGQIAHFTGIANLDFHGAPLQSLGANHDADGITDEVGILDGTFTWDVTCMSNDHGHGTADVLMYFGFNRPAYREFEGEAGARYKVNVVDTWDMTEEELPGTFEGKFRIDLPSKQYMLLRLTKVEA